MIWWRAFRIIRWKEAGQIAVVVESTSNRWR